MPSDDGLGSDDHEGISPPWPELAECNPEFSISCSEARTRLLLCVDRELLPQGKLDNGLLLACPEHGPYRGENNRCVGEKDSDHRRILNAGPQEIETESPALLLVACLAGDPASRCIADRY